MKFNVYRIVASTSSFSSPQTQDSRLDLVRLLSSSVAASYQAFLLFVLNAPGIFVAFGNTDSFQYLPKGSALHVGLSRQSLASCGVTNLHNKNDTDDDLV